MEFYAFANQPLSDQQLQQQLTPEQLPQFCDSIVRCVAFGSDWGEYETVWGLFKITIEPIRGGVRLSMPSCPNALSWSITTGLPPEPEQTVIHATILRQEHDPDFIESLEDFVVEWQEGLESDQTAPSA
uniref:Uncharacterized protein n=1 Tax=Magnetococcus massalia (strain MO-1) TaxID=451514 RepID=A0A1S7LGU0_MAGMO|nr:Conserved protein of unknown function [Candidatus Magnetococcus massalia]